MKTNPTKRKTPARVGSRPRTLRLRAPKGCTAVSLAGREFAVKDGVVAVPIALAAILVHAHGFAYEDWRTNAPTSPRPSPP